MEDVNKRRLSFSFLNFNTVFETTPEKFANNERVGISALKFETEKAEIEKVLSQRSLSLRSLRSLNFFFLSDRHDHMETRLKLPYKTFLLS